MQRTVVLQPSRYEVRGKNVFIVTEEVRTIAYCYGSFSTQKDAQRVADLLNNKEAV